MYGVVLWSDKEDSKAVIWCEDHGDLAFYSGKADRAFESCSLDAGDLVSFTVSDGRDMRLATNPRLLAERQFPGLAESLLAGSGQAPATERAAHPATGAESNVIAFVPREARARLAS